MSFCCGKLQIRRVRVKHAPDFAANPDWCVQARTLPRFSATATNENGRPIRNAVRAVLP